MKSLRIINGKPKYLECSMGGSYYIDCKIIDHSKNWYCIEYSDTNTDGTEKVKIPIDDVEKIDQHYNKYDNNYKDDVYNFLQNVKHNEISLDKAVEIMLNGGETKL